MTRRRYCVLGARGMLGRALLRHLEANGRDVVALTRREFGAAVAPFDGLARHVDGATTVINCIALTGGVAFDELITVNATFPRRLAALCAVLGADLIHISSNGVFSGDAGRYDERAVPDPVDAYGVSKLLGEDARSMVLRTSIVGLEPAPGRYLLSWAQRSAGSTVSGYTNHLWNGVTTLALAVAIESIVQDGLYEPGVHHLHSSRDVSKYELLRLIDAAFELDLRVEPGEAAKPVDRTLRSTGILSSRLFPLDLADQLGALRSSGGA